MSVQKDILKYRSTLENVVFIGLTGSCGKTTTSNLIADLLRPELVGTHSPDNGNCGTPLVNHLLNVNPHHDFCVQELGAWGPNTLDKGLNIVQPTIGAVLNIRNDHYSAFRGVQNTQAEKGKLVRCLPSSGIAILNADDPLVWEMRHWTSAKVIGVGQSSSATFRATNVNSCWPDRLSFDLRYKGHEYKVETSLVGEHLLSSALVALAVSTTLGLGIELSIAKIKRLQPSARRMSPVVIEPGITFIRDDFKATKDSLPEMLYFLSHASAKRKIAVVGRISDHPGRSRSVYTKLAKDAAEIVDLLIFVGERPEDLWGRHRRNSASFLSELGAAKEKIRLFKSVYDASVFLRDELVKGDLVVLKGSCVADHLERVLLNFQTPVECWKNACGKDIACDACDQIHKYSPPENVFT